MKISVFLFFLGIISIYAGNSYSQTTRLSLDLREATVGEVLESIEDQSEFYFLYSNKLVDVERMVSLQYKNEPVNNILDHLFANTDIRYKLFDRQIILSPKEILEKTLKLISMKPQGQEITGTVTDKDGNPLPGVNIVIKGTIKGTITNVDGNYAIEASPDASLIFSFIGYQNQIIDISGRVKIDVAMEEAITELDEVVAIGYGRQKKINLTGAVSTISGENIVKRMVTQASQALSGEVSGVTVTQGSGEPGKDQGTIRIRGMGTFSGAGMDPLVLIDGIPGNINDVDPSNIDNISVLKGAASASIYGSRAANGVIIIETKQGKAGELKITYSSYIGKQEATELPQMVDSWTYAEMKNLALSNSGKGLEYTEEDIEKLRSGDYPEEYPNYPHLEKLFTSGDALQTKHNLSFQGGTEKTKFLASIGYLQQNGLIKENSNTRYDMRINLNTQLRDNLKLDAKLFGNYAVVTEPMFIKQGVVQGMADILRLAQQFHNDINGKYADGTYGTYRGFMSPDAALDGKGFGEDKNSYFGNNISLEWNVISSLILTGRISYRLRGSWQKDFGAEFRTDPETLFGPTQVDMYTSRGQDLNLELLADYDKTFGGHNFHLLGGFSQQSHMAEWMGAFRDDFPTVELNELDVGSTVNDSNNGNANAWKLRSYFGRISYSFNDKYLLEGNIRYDGTSRFAKNTRWGLFPSISAGWILSREDFFNIPWIEQLKIRGSHGVLGNQEIGNYPYQRTLDLGYNAAFGVGAAEGMHSGAQLTTLPFAGITWETTRATNVGVDIILFKGKINFTADAYYKKTFDILYSITTAMVLGMDVGEQNAGEVLNKGFDLELTYKNLIGDFSYSISPLFSFNHNEIIDLAGVEKDIPAGLFEGESISSIYGYKTDGLFMDQQDIDNFAVQNYQAKPGLPRYLDISGPDGVPDGVVTAVYDRTVIGNGFPKYNYGMRLTADYKGFDLYLQLQGHGGYEKLITTYQLPMYNQRNIEEWHVESRWTEENPDRYAEYPRWELIGYDFPWANMNLEYWLRNASYLRIKNVQLGYNIPVANSFFDSFRVYISGQNVYTFDHFYEGVDPEMTTYGYENSGYYPPTRLWSIGVNVQF